MCIPVSMPPFHPVFCKCFPLIKSNHMGKELIDAFNKVNFSGNRIWWERVRRRPGDANKNTQHSAPLLLLNIYSYSFS